MKCRYCYNCTSTVILIFFFLDRTINRIKYQQEKYSISPCKDLFIFFNFTEVRYFEQNNSIFLKMI